MLQHKTHYQACPVPYHETALMNLAESGQDFADQGEEPAPNRSKSKQEHHIQTPLLMHIQALPYGIKLADSNKNNNEKKTNFKFL